ncbi:MAG: helix-turn-helix transcriptional regulator [Fluviicola sp.]|nr:helix-turn-helix transcriptional regulator [Fluviicola sp.]
MCATLPSLHQKATDLLINKKNIKAALPLYEKTISLAQECNNCEHQFSSFFEIGNYYYSISQFDNALLWYKKGLENKKCASDFKNLAGINSNIGVIYLGKGYLKTAISFFIAARKDLEKLGEKNQNYWINYINIGVAFMEMEDLASAKRIFDKIDSKFSPTTSFLVAINLAKIAALKNDKKTFNFHVNRADQLIKQVRLYENTLDELKLEFYVKFQDKKNLTKLYNDKIDAYASAYIYTKLLMQQASLIITQKIIGDPKNIDALREEVMSQDDITNQLAYFELIKLMSLRQKNYKLYANALERIMQLQDEKRLENTTNALKDYQVLVEKTSLKQENEQLRTQQNINVLKIKNQQYLNFFLIISSLFLIVLGLYLYSYFQRKEKTKTNVIVEISKDLETSHEMQYSLQQKLRNQELRMEEILKTVGKIAILRKQIDAYFNNKKLKNTNPEELAELKNAKLDVDLFFNNYTELAIIASQKEAYSFEKLRINDLFKEKLSDKELNVLSLIMNNYSSKEIGILLNKTEKAIEYTRKNLRIKLGIDSATQIDVFVRNELKSFDV